MGLPQPPAGRLACLCSQAQTIQTPSDHPYSMRSLPYGVFMSVSAQASPNAPTPTSVSGGPEMTVELSPITDLDVAAVADFLHANLNSRVPMSMWARALSVPWKAEAPNHGFMLQDGERVVGAYLAFYAERVIAGKVERFCNLGAWCVLPDFRFHSLRLLKALLAQDGYHFTDLSPSGNVVPLNARFDFRSLDTSTALVPNLPWPTLVRRTRISADPDVIESTLAGAELELYRDHAQAAAVSHLVLIQGGDSCYVMFRKVRRKDLPVFAAILHVGTPSCSVAPSVR